MAPDPRPTDPAPPVLSLSDEDLMARVAEDDEQSVHGARPALPDARDQPGQPAAQRREVSEDIAQEVFVRVHRAPQELPAGSKFSTWLFTIAANLAKNEIRGGGSAGATGRASTRCRRSLKDASLQFADPNRGREESSKQRSSSQE